MGLLHFELRYHARQHVYRIAAVALFLFGAVLQTAPTSFGSGVLSNSPYAIAFLISLLSMGVGAVVALFTGNAILRDRESKMEPIIFATNISRGRYLGSRSLGLLIATTTVFSLGVLGMFLASLLPGPDPDAFGPVQPLYYLWALVVIAMPIVLLNCSVIFFTAAMTRNTMATYVGALFLYMLFFGLTIISKSPLMAGAASLSASPGDISGLLDPFGLVGVMDQTRTWSSLQRNTQLPPLAGLFLFNRLVWAGIPLLLYGLTVLLFSFRVPGKQKRKEETAAEAGRTTTAYHTVRPTRAGFARELTAFLSQTRIYVSAVIKSYPFLALAIMWSMLIGVNLFDFLRRGAMQVHFYPFAGVLLPGIHLPVVIFGGLIVIFYSAELAHFERSCTMSGLTDATPGSSGMFWASKVATLAVIVTGLSLYSLLMVLGIQAAFGFFDGTPSIILAFLISASVPLALVGLLGLFLQALVPNKHVAMVLGFAAMFFMLTPLPEMVGLEHPLLRFAYIPDYTLSPMAGAGYHDDTHGWFLLHNMGLAGLLAAVTLRLCPRGLGRRQPLSKPALGFALVNLLACIAGGLAIYHHTNTKGTYLSRAARLDLSERYEREFAQFAERAQPTPTAANIEVDIFPENRSFALKGQLTLENRTAQAITELLVGIQRGTEQKIISVSGADLAKQDDALGQYWFSFTEPLQPGAQSQISFQLEGRHTGFMPLNKGSYILESATYLEVDQYLPFVGYNPRWEITGERERSMRNLPEHKPQSAGAQSPEPGTQDLQLVVSTSAGQTVVAPATLRRSWEEGERRYFQFNGKAPSPLWLGLASARYEKRSQTHKGVEVNVFHHPKHPFNVDNMLAAARAAMDYHEQHFGPVPQAPLQLAEIPKFTDKYWATAYPESIFGVEDSIFILNQNAHTFDVAFRSTIHKMAHHWWDADPALHEGREMLVEFLANYLEMVVYEEKYGRDGTNLFLYECSRLYFRIRAFGDRVEFPMTLAYGQPHVYYFKSGHVVYALRELLGEAALNGVLSGLFADFPAPGGATATVLAQRLVEAAPEEYRDRVKELMTDVVYYDNQVVSARAVRFEDGGITVSVHIQATKVRRDASGEDSESAVNDFVELAFYEGEAQVDLHKVLLNEQDQHITLQVRGSPDRLTLDPRMLRLEANYSDNERKIQVDRYLAGKEARPE